MTKSVFDQSRLSESRSVKSAAETIHLHRPNVQQVISVSFDRSHDEISWSTVLQIRRSDDEKLLSRKPGELNERNEDSSFEIHQIFSIFRCGSMPRIENLYRIILFSNPFYRFRFVQSIHEFLFSFSTQRQVRRVLGRADSGAAAEIEAGDDFWKNEKKN